jgi:hypothetical protein
MNNKDAAQGETERGLVEGIIEALGNKHSQLDINFQKTTIKVPGIHQMLELDGLVTLSVHVRELTEEEKLTSSKKNVTILTPPKP